LKFKVGDRVLCYCLAHIGKWGKGIISEIRTHKERMRGLLPIVVNMDDGHIFAFDEEDLELVKERVEFS
jgi:hypothetical protein